MLTEINQIPELEHICSVSQYLATLLRRNPDFLHWLWHGRQIRRRYPLTELYESLKSQAAAADSFRGLLKVYRSFKQLHFLRIGARDLLGWAGLEETTAQLSDLARVALQVGLETLQNRPRWWLDDDDDSLWQEVRPLWRLVVLGLGKLGGEELNYVSDIDLSYFRRRREPTAEVPERSVVLLNRLCQRLAALLSDPVNGDRVFLVDLRLRPGGKEGELVPSVDAASEYYLNHGRTWERQMLLKARPVAGDRSLGTAFIQEVRPFVFRRFLDFQALDELKAMRDRILAEVGRQKVRGRFDVKLGEGGIREIEFMVQAFQLIYGGRYPDLDEPNTLRCLNKVEASGLLPAAVIADMRNAYTFLRRVEHWIQLDQNRRTQKIPRSPGARIRLAEALGYNGDFQRLSEELRAHCARVHDHFSQLFRSQDTGDAVEAEGEESSSGGARQEAGGWDRASLARSFSGVCSALDSFPDSVRQTVGGVLRGFQRRCDDSILEKIDARLAGYFIQVKRRPGLRRAFEQSASWIEGLCRGIGQSELVASLLSHQPSLIDGVTEMGEGALDGVGWEVFADRVLGKIQSFEEAVEWIRRLKNERLLALALRDLAGDLPSPGLEENLTGLADFVVERTYERVLDLLRLPRGLPLIVLALGKLGSRELNYLSDLDIMFVYDPAPGEPGDRIPSQVVRLIQRFNRMLSVPLQEGPGYAVDTRLRPTGNYGPLVVTRKAWVNYYAKKADLWEIQALLRMRPVAGSEKLAQWVRQAQEEICYRLRRPEDVWPRLCHLRSRMEAERSGDGGDWIDLKLGYGGVVDFEFFVQGFLLIHGDKELGGYGGNVRRALPGILAEMVSSGKKRELVKIFDDFRAMEQRLQLHLNLSTSKLSRSQFDTLVQLGLWPVAERGARIETWQDFHTVRRRVRALWERVCRPS